MYSKWIKRIFDFILSAILLVIFLTIFKILKRDGINALGQATMTRFNPESQKNSKVTL